METPDIKVAQMAVRAQAFAQSLVLDHFTHTPLTVVDNKHALTLTKLGGAIDALGGKEAIQEGRGFELATSVKATTRHQLEALVKNVNRTAGAIADENETPEIMTKFRMPHGSGDEQLKARAIAMADGIVELGLDAEFEAQSFPNAATTVRNAAGNFEVDAGAQGVSLSKQAGATKAIPGFIKMIKSAVKTLDSIYHNMFDGDAELLGAWKSASHVEKVAVKHPRTPKPAEGEADAK